MLFNSFHLGLFLCIAMTLGCNSEPSTPKPMSAEVMKLFNSLLASERESAKWDAEYDKKFEQWNEASSKKLNAIGTPNEAKARAEADDLKSELDFIIQKQSQYIYVNGKDDKTIRDDILEKIVKLDPDAYWPAEALATSSAGGVRRQGKISTWLEQDLLDRLRSMNSLLRN